MIAMHSYSQFQALVPPDYGIDRKVLKRRALAEKESKACA